MVISAYQVNNVLRVYGDQLRQGKIAQRPKAAGPGREPDQVNISSTARKQAMIDKIATNVLERVTRFEPEKPGVDGEASLEASVFERLKQKVGRDLAVAKSDSSEFIFKEIGEDGETTRSLSIKDSEFLTSELKQIIRETVDEPPV